MVDCYYKIFGAKPKLSFLSPLENGEYPELYTSEHLYSDVVQKYQSMIGEIKWAESLGRLDVNIVVTTLASVRAEPRQGHFDSCKRVISYLAKFKWATIRIRTEEPDFTSTPITPHDWEDSVYGKFK